MLHDELEQELLVLVDELAEDHTVNGVEVVCYLGRERRDVDQVLVLNRTVRTYAGRTTQVAPPVPDGTVAIDGHTYQVGGVALYDAVFKAEVYRLL